jgi:hypothetical protein
MRCAHEVHALASSDRSRYHCRFLKAKSETTMSKIVMGGAFAALFLSAGCATDPYLQDSATLGASGQFGAPAIHMEDGQRKEFMVGSRIPGEVDEPARLRGKPHGEAALGSVERRRLNIRAARTAHPTNDPSHPRRKR